MSKKADARAGTPATLALTRAGVTFSTHSYVHDASAPNFGLEAAAKLQLNPGRVFKTLLVETDGTLSVAIVPVNALLDLRALAFTVGAKKASLADPTFVERKTGYVIGGISPIAQKTRYRTVIDDSALGFETMFVSGGRRGLDLELAPMDLARVCSATFAPIAR